MRTPSTARKKARKPFSGQSCVLTECDCFATRKSEREDALVAIVIDCFFLQHSTTPLNYMIFYSHPHVVLTTPTPQIRTFTALRTIRLLRVAQRVRFWPAFREMWAIVSSFAASMMTIFWVIVIVFIVNYCFGILSLKVIGQAAGYQVGQAACLIGQAAGDRFSPFTVLWAIVSSFVASMMTIFCFWVIAIVFILYSQLLFRDLVPQSDRASGGLSGIVSSFAASMMTILILPRHVNGYCVYCQLLFRDLIP